LMADDFEEDWASSSHDFLAKPVNTVEVPQTLNHAISCVLDISWESCFVAFCSFFVGIAYFSLRYFVIFVLSPPP
jgi:hypothetical protein